MSIRYHDRELFPSHQLKMLGLKPTAERPSCDPVRGQCPWCLKTSIGWLINHGPDFKGFDKKWGWGVKGIPYRMCDECDRTWQDVTEEQLGRPLPWVVDGPSWREQERERKEKESAAERLSAGMWAASQIAKNVQLTPWTWRDKFKEGPKERRPERAKWLGRASTDLEDWLPIEREELEAELLKMVDELSPAQAETVRQYYWGDQTMKVPGLSHKNGPCRMMCAMKTLQHPERLKRVAALL